MLLAGGAKDRGVAAELKSCDYGPSCQQREANVHSSAFLASGPRDLKMVPTYFPLWAFLFSFGFINMVWSMAVPFRMYFNISAHMLCVWLRMKKWYSLL